MFHLFSPNIDSIVISTIWHSSELNNFFPIIKWPPSFFLAPRDLFFPAYPPNSYFLLACTLTIPLTSNIPPHCFFTHIYIFRIVKSVCNVRQWGFPVCPQTSDDYWDMAIVQTFAFPDFLTFSVLPRESYLLKTLYTVVFGIFIILATCPYDWLPLINSTMESLWLTDKSVDLPDILLSAVYLRFSVQTHW